MPDKKPSKNRLLVSHDNKAAMLTNPDPHKHLILIVQIFKHFV
jgi:hypothetical protein